MKGGPRDGPTRKDAAWRKSEVQYRRLFEYARDGILILDERAGKIIDANPFMCELLGFDLDHFLGKELWEIGLFADIAASSVGFPRPASQRLHSIRPPAARNAGQEKGRCRGGCQFRHQAGGQLVIQCNIRDCSERFRLEREVRNSLEEKEVLLKEVHHRVSRTCK